MRYIRKLLKTFFPLCVIMSKNEVRKEDGPLARYEKKRKRNGFKLTIIAVFLLLFLFLLSVVFILGTGGSGKLPDLPTNPTKAPTEPPATAAAPGFDENDPQNFFQQEADLEDDKKINIWNWITDALASDKVNETEELTLGVDVARYQGTIDWPQVAASGVDFAIVRLGYRSLVDGVITEDPNADYNLQQAGKAGLKLGAYFFSTAITVEEAIEEANWVADYLAPYAITYPVAYNCEGFGDPENRQYPLSKTERTDIALAFLKQIEKRGYEAMFYASKNEMTEDAKWEVSRIDPHYKIWVAQYPEEPYPDTEKSSYEGIHHMWQYTRNGILPGIPESVDVNIAYFGYDGTEEAISDETVPEVQADPEALMPFSEVSDYVTSKSETNLRSIPSQGEDSQVLAVLKKGQIAKRIGISTGGWSKLEFEGNTYYAVTNLLVEVTQDGKEKPPEAGEIQTQFREVSDSVTAKDVVNLRNIPSTQRADSKVIAQLKNGEIIKRTGINEDVGWSRVEYNGQVLYCVSSYLEVVE